MNSIESSPNYRKHKHHHMKIVLRPDTKHHAQLMCAQCHKRNHIAWLSVKQCEVIADMISSK